MLVGPGLSFHLTVHSYSTKFPIKSRVRYKLAWPVCGTAKRRLPCCLPSCVQPFLARPCARARLSIYRRCAPLGCSTKCVSACGCCTTADAPSRRTCTGRAPSSGSTAYRTAAKRTLVNFRNQPVAVVRCRPAALQRARSFGADLLAHAVGRIAVIEGVNQVAAAAAGQRAEAAVHRSSMR